MSTHPSDDASSTRRHGSLAAVALCLLVAAVPLAAVAAAAGPGQGAPPAGSLGDARAPDGSVDPRPDDRGIAPRRGAVAEAAHGQPAQTGLPDATRGQLAGIALVVIVLAVIGAAIWGVRPVVRDRVDRAPGWRGWGSAREGAGAGPPHVASEEELLTDEERIIELLEENGGRVKQQHVVETTDWSKAKVSRLLSSMEEEEEIVRIQLGREKLIFLSGHEPSGVRSTLRED